MKISLGAQPLLHPLPVLIIGTYGQNSKPNLLNAAWGGICCSKPPCIAFSTREATQTFQNVVSKKAFTVNIPSTNFVRQADFTGIFSGKDLDKFEKTGLTPIKSNKVDAPYIEQFPYILECKLIKQIKLGLHTQFIGEIVDVKADEAVLNSKGMPDIEKVKPIIFGSFSNPNYYAIGEKLGDAFKLGEELASKE